MNQILNSWVHCLIAFGMISKVIYSVRHLPGFWTVALPSESIGVGSYSKILTMQIASPRMTLGIHFSIKSSMLVLLFRDNSIPQEPKSVHPVLSP